MSTPIEEAVVRVTADTSSAERELRRFATRVSQDLRDTLSGTADGARETAVSTDRAAGSTGRLGSSLRALQGPATRLSLLAASVGSLVPLAASAVAAVEAIGPAAAGAATGFLAIKQATVALKLGMIGVQDAVTAALDPSKAKEFDKAIKGLAPNAREFATAVRDLQPSFRALQQSVQNKLFAGFGDELKAVSSSVLPVFRSNLENTASTLNRMGLSVSLAVQGLANNGALGQALSGANKGLSNLALVPAKVVTSLGQLAAAGAPVFDRLTKIIAKTADRISKSLSDAFKSGELTQSIDQALTLVLQLGKVAVNAFGILRNVLGSVSQSGGGLVGVLVQITGEIRKATATAGFQTAMSALAQTMSVIGQTIAPLLVQALASLGPVVTALAQPTQILVQNLGAGLSAVIAGLAPVLLQAARAVGSFLVAVSPLLPVIGNLAGAVLGSLTPVFASLAQALTSLQPTFFQLAVSLQATLLPALSALPGIVTPLAQAFVALTSALVPVTTQLLVSLTPALVLLGQSLGQLLVALGPVIAAIGVQLAAAIEAVTPALIAVIPVIGRVATFLTQLASGVLNSLVIPSLRVVAQLLQGNFSGAWRTAQQAVASAGATMTSTGRTILSAISSALSSLVGVIRTQIGNAVSTLRSLPGRARAALAGSAGVLVSVGRNIVAGLVRGIQGGIGLVTSAARNLASSALSAAKSALGIASPSKAFASIGKDVGRGFIVGLTGTASQIKRVTTDLANDITQAFRGRATLRDDRLVAFVQTQNNRLVSLANQRDAIAKRIADANKFAADTTKAALDAFSLSAISQANNGAVSRGAIITGLESAAAQVRRFAAQINSLRKKGLRKDLLSQIIGLGPEQGAELAASLSRQSASTIKQINAQQAALVKASQGLGRTSADVLFDAGKQAGRGFLTGLRAQQKQIEALMLSIAKGMQRAIKRALGIRSPSRVFAQIGDDTATGLEKGFLAGVPAVVSAVRSAAQTMVNTARTSALPTAPQAFLGQAVNQVRTQPATPSVSNVNLTVVNRGVVGSRSEVLNWLTDSLDTLARQRRLPA